MICQKCEKRHVGCHAKCVDYQSYRKEIEAIKDEKRQYRYLYDHTLHTVKSAPRGFERK